VLVTGASGALGRLLVALLGRRGWRTRALVHDRPAESADEAMTGDLSDVASLARAVEGAGAVVHLAAVTHARRPRDYERVNVEGTSALLDAARREDVARFVHVSTRAASEHGGAYSVSKLRSEELVRGSGLPFAIVRLPEVYGAGGGEGVDRMLDLAARGRPVPVAGDGSDLLCPVFADDAVAAVAAALEADRALGNTYTLAGECMTAVELACSAAEHFGTRSRVMHVPLAALHAAAVLGRVLPLPVYPDQVQRLRAAKPPASPEAREDLGFEPRSLAEGLAALHRGL
jgi:nucleoside-diphosphate-sugar epimerase